MTYEQFVARAVREAELKIRAPAGWWGNWRDIASADGRVRVLFSASEWRIRLDDKLVSKHDSRDFAIRKAAKLAAGLTNNTRPPEQRR